MNTLYIVGEINEDSFKQFDIKLRRFEKENSSPSNRANIVMLSAGGDAYTALAYYDRIRNSPIIISVEAYGFVASAAVLILAAGKFRKLSSSAWVMVHEDGNDVEEGMKVSQVEKKALHSRRLETQWNNILAKVTKASADKWEELHKAETYLTADECLELGLIEEII